MAGSGGLLDFAVPSGGFRKSRAVTQFLHKMEKDSMALRLESVELSSRDTEGQQISLAMQLSGLVLGGNPKNAGSQ